MRGYLHERVKPLISIRGLVVLANIENFVYMNEYLSLPLSPEQLYRLNFEEFETDHWTDIDYTIKIFELEDGTNQQYLNVVDQLISIPLKTVGTL